MAVLRLGVVLPTFSSELGPVVAAAEEAEAAGLHGCFCYDHLWPIGQPGRPALAPFPLLGLLAARTSRVALGTLVARVGLVPDLVLKSELATLVELLGERLVAGLGTGDHLSAPEQLAYGVPIAPPQQRREQVERLARELVDGGVTTWVGGRAAATVALARRSGAVPNVWAAPAGEVAAVAASGPVTWGGALPNEEVAAAERLASLARAGASWAVVSWPGSAAPLVAAAQAAGVSLGHPGP